MNSFLIWSLVLFFIGALIAVIEVIVPSGGILAIVSLSALGASLYCAYQLSGLALAVVAALEAISVPLAVLLTFRILPRTRIGKDLMLAPPIASKPDRAVLSNKHTDGEFEALHGQEGITATMLRPAGIVEIDGKRISVVTNGEMIDADTPVRVARVEGNRIVVEAIKA